jgi:hypothetical protein
MKTSHLTPFNFFLQWMAVEVVHKLQVLWFFRVVCRLDLSFLIVLWKLSNEMILIVTVTCVLQVYMNTQMKRSLRSSVPSYCYKKLKLRGLILEWKSSDCTFYNTDIQFGLSRGIFIALCASLLEPLISCNSWLGNFLRQFRSCLPLRASILIVCLRAWISAVKKDNYRTWHLLKVGCHRLLKLSKELVICVHRNIYQIIVIRPVFQLQVVIKKIWLWVIIST